MAKKYYREDDDTRIPNSRHAGIVVRDGKILLMYRIFEGFPYYTIPGGHIRKGELGTEAVIREIEEEMSIKVKDPKLVFEFRDYKNDNFDFYYSCKYVSGEPELKGEEKVRNTPENQYHPMWIELEKIETLNLLPIFAKGWIVETLIKKG